MRSNLPEVATLTIADKFIITFILMSLLPIFYITGNLFPL